MRIIPAIDIIDGKCVRLSKGDYNTKKIYLFPSKIELNILKINSIKKYLKKRNLNI